MLVFSYSHEIMSFRKPYFIRTLFEHFYHLLSISIHTLPMMTQNMCNASYMVANQKSSINTVDC